MEDTFIFMASLHSAQGTTSMRWLQRLVVDMLYVGAAAGKQVGLVGGLTFSSPLKLYAFSLAFLAQ